MTRGRIVHVSVWKPCGAFETGISANVMPGRGRKPAGPCFLIELDFFLFRSLPLFFFFFRPSACRMRTPFRVIVNELRALVRIRILLYRSSNIGRVEQRASWTSFSVFLFAFFFEGIRDLQRRRLTVPAISNNRNCCCQFFKKKKRRNERAEITAWTRRCSISISLRKGRLWELRRIAFSAMPNLPLLLLAPACSEHLLLCIPVRVPFI